MKVSVFILWFAIFPLMVATADATSKGEDFLNELRDRYQSERVLDEQRYLDFLADRSLRSKLLSQARQDLAQLNKETADLEKQFHHNEKQLLDFKNFYQQRAGGVEELLSIVQRNASDMKKNISESFINLLLPEHLETLTSLIEARVSFRLADLETLWHLSLEWLSAQAQNTRFHSDLVLADGTSESRELIHVGPFSLVSNESLLVYDVNHGHLSSVYYPAAFLPLSDSRQGDGFISAPIDPSRGAMLIAFSGAPTFLERIVQGGVVVYLILVLGVVGLLLAGERIFFLIRNLRLVRYQKTNSDYRDDNPLGRVLRECQASRATSMEKLELSLDAAIVREMPLLHRGFGTLKILIAVAPMLGLLGTVLGMIETFQAITLFGSGDPTIMSSGISQALITTMLGLAVAIPLLLLYTLANSYSKEIQQILEEQSAAIIVDHWVVKDLEQTDAVV